MTRGDVVWVKGGGDYTGKPRPAVIIQNDLFAGMDSVTLCPLTSHIADDEEIVRVSIEPNKRNGLDKPSQVMTDKTVTVARTRITKKIGRLNDEELAEVGDALKLWLSLY